jgi:hypothetical protein
VDKHLSTRALTSNTLTMTDGMWYSIRGGTDSDLSSQQAIQTTRWRYPSSLLLINFHQVFCPAYSISLFYFMILNLPDPTSLCCLHNIALCTSPSSTTACDLRSSCAVSSPCPHPLSPRHNLPRAVLTLLLLPQIQNL